MNYKKTSVRYSGKSFSIEDEQIKWRIINGIQLFKRAADDKAEMCIRDRVYVWAGIRNSCIAVAGGKGRS